MKKILAVSILVIFLLSIVAVSFAHSEEASDSQDNDKSEKLREITFERQQEALEKIKEHQEKLAEKQNKVKELKHNVESSKDLKKFENSKEFMSTNIDLMIEYLQKLKSRVDSSTDISEEEAQQLIDQIDQRIDKLTQEKSKVQDRQDIVNLRKDLKDLKEINKDLRDFSVESADKVVHRRVGEIIKRAESLERKLDRILSGSNSTNSSQVNSLVDQFKAKIADAKDKYNKAIDLFDQARSANNSFSRHQIILDAHQNLVNAQFDLKGAHLILVEIFRILKPVESEDHEDNQGENQTCIISVPNISQKSFGYIVFRNNCDNKTWTVVVKDATNHGFDNIGAIKANNSAYDGKEVKVRGTLKFIGSDINSDSRFVLDSQGNQIRVGVFAPVSANTSCPACPVQNKTMIEMLNTQIDVLGVVSEINESNISVPIITVSKLLNESDLVSKASGTITTNTTFSDIKKIDFESGDVLSSTNNTITFNLSMDTLDKMTFKTDGEVRFDLYIDSAHQKNFVYLGTSLSNPSDIPFTLTTI